MKSDKSMTNKAKKTVPKKTAKKVSVIKKNVSQYVPFQWVLLSVLLMVTALVYANSLHGGLLNFDDIEYFTNYPEVLKLTWKNVGVYFSHYYVIMYQPLPVLSFAMNYHFTGLNTTPMHVVNLFFHLMNIMLVFILLRKVTERFDVAFIVAILFAIHPMNVEAVSWISARSSGMYAFFYLLSLIFYMDYLRKGLKWKYLILAFLFFIFSLFSKAQAVTLPVVLLAFDYYFSRKLISRRVWLEKIPYFMLSIVFGIVAMANSGTLANITEGMMVDYSLIDRFFLVCYSFVFYVFKLFVPITLAAVYVYPPKVNGHLPLLYYFTPIVLAAVFYLIYKARHHRYIMLGVALFFITIALNIQMIPSRLFIVTERYAYFPYIGLFFIFGMFYANLLKKKETRFKQLRSIITLSLVIYTVVFAVTIYERNKVWQSDIPFMTDILQKNPEAPYLSRAYSKRGQAYIVINNYPMAIKDFTESIRLKPDEWASYFDRGSCYWKMQQVKEALADFDMTVKYNGRTSVVYANRAVARFFEHDYLGALQDCNLSINMDSTRKQVFNTRGAAKYTLNDFAGAEHDYTKAIALEPTYNEALKNRGDLRYALKRFPEACNDWKQAALFGNVEAQRSLETYCK